MPDDRTNEGKRSSAPLCVASLRMLLDQLQQSDQVPEEFEQINLHILAAFDLSLRWAYSELSNDQRQEIDTRESANEHSATQDTV